MIPDQIQQNPIEDIPSVQVARGADAVGAAGCALGGWSPRQESGTTSLLHNKGPGSPRLFRYFVIAPGLNYFSYLDLSDSGVRPVRKPGVTV